MILLCGLPEEPPISLLAAELARTGRPYALLDQRRFSQATVWYEVDAGTVRGRAELNSMTVALEDVTGAYIRLIDGRPPPATRDGPDSADRLRSAAVHAALLGWCEVSPCRVVSRMSAQTSNSSKPYQAQVIAAHGFSIPETLISSDPDLVREFCRRHRRVVYKSISGVRSIVQAMTDSDLERLEAVRWCPVQFQAFVEGTNVRVHTVDDAVFATAIVSEATDYRYAHQQIGSNPQMYEVFLPAEVRARCVAVGRSLGLAFAGIDLKITPSGEVFCFEVNPSPAYSYYEQQTGQGIARALAAYLAGSVGT